MGDYQGFANGQSGIQSHKSDGAGQQRQNESNQLVN
jgi:hypothetical protein